MTALKSLVSPCLLLGLLFSAGNAVADFERLKQRQCERWLVDDRDHIYISLGRRQRQCQCERKR